MKKEKDDIPTKEEFDKVHKYNAKLGEKYLVQGAPIKIVFSDVEVNAVASEKKISWFNPVTGRGLIKKKKFRLIQGKPNYIIFYALLQSVKQSLKRDKVIKLLDLYPETKNFIPENSAKISQYVKQLRNTTGLTYNDIIQNNGTITLIISIEKRHPKPS
ncbi:MAG: hypothetical protein WCG99_03510 [Candidatus Berkelbacteria bacterium]